MALGGAQCYTKSPMNSSFSSSPSQFLEVFALAVRYGESRCGLKSCCVVCSALGSLPAFLCLRFTAEGFAYPSQVAAAFVRASVTSSLIVYQQPE